MRVEALVASLSGSRAGFGAGEQRGGAVRL
jgi:hypothetical protein